jgi:CubicO group peptidase (beta-lactamase class C family)
MLASVAVLAVTALSGATWAEPVTREQVTAALPGLEAMAHEIVETGGVPGIAIAVVHDDELVYLQGFGLRAMGRPEAVDGDTVFQIASMSKPISATVVAALVGEGLVSWESRIADLMPDFALHDPYPTANVTVRDLFNHRSGLPGGAGNDLEDIGFDRDTVVRRLRLVPAASSFRAGYAYSNAGITVGALAAAIPTGKDWETVAEEWLFDPLGMASTSYRHQAFLDRANASSLHVRDGDGWVARIRRDATVQAPAGAVSSTARDLATWMRLELAHGELDGEQVIDAAALDATHAPLMARGANPVTGASSFYGLGWNVEFGRHGLTWGHAGAFSVGGRTLVTLFPESDLGIVVLANAFPSGVPEGLADSFADLVFDGEVAQDYLASWNAAYESLFGPAIAAAIATYATVPDPATAALPAAAYVGTDANAYAGEAVVSGDDAGLTLTLGPGGARTYPMRHFDRDLFTYFASPEMPDMPSAIRFAIGPDGRAETITVEPLNDSGLGTLTRVAP